jgi:hypothetical protein
MPSTFGSLDNARAVIGELVERYRANRDRYESSAYNEETARNEFINPLFEAMGWDISNKAGAAEQYKDVIHEESIKVGDFTKAPDYTFRFGGVRKFFVEAKKPFVDLKSDPDPAYQLRRYAWSAKLPLSILTDFEEFAVYDTRIKPRVGDKASVGRILYLTLEELLPKLEDIWNIFSKDAVLKGSFDRYAEATLGKRGTSEVDAEFLKDIEGWREELAKNLALRNEDLTEDDLNFAVQTTIDRIIFMRIAEGRGAELYGGLLALTNGPHIYRRLVELYRKADHRYNSGLFDFSADGDRLTLGLTIDDKVLKPILADLYYPQSPYEFSVLPAEILGNVYEQFLGKVIRLTKGHRAVVEEKPEVKKAGGVYYTPSYIVEYIVEQTVGTLTEGKSPKQMEKLRILDPACGSGSFLIVAYQHLLDAHHDWYREHEPQKHRKAVFLGPGGWRLTTAEKRRILLNNIYGVDIDRQAVEVTKLSLLLKVMEGENNETLTQQTLFGERALPSLEQNIKCGNSIIGLDYYEQEQIPLLGDGERHRINAFDWKSEFAAIFEAGGFDVVIGNPPYRRELDYKHLMDEIASTSFGRLYRVPRMDLWYYFVHRGLEVLRPSGTLSFIVNAYWTSGTGAEKLIATLRDDAHIEEIFCFDKLKVFHRVAGQHMIVRIRKEHLRTPTIIRVVQPNEETTAEPFVLGRASVAMFKKTADQLFRLGKVDLQRPADEMLAKLGRWVPLEKLGKVRQGIAENPASINRKTNERFGKRFVVGQGVFALCGEEVKKLHPTTAERALLRPYWDLCDLGRYFLAEKPSLTLIYSTRQTCPDIRLCPNLQDHLGRFRIIMEGRRETRNGSNSWWHLHWPRDEAIWEAPKVLSVQMSRRPAFVPALNPVYVPFSVNVFVPFLSTREDLNYLVALLNSRLLWQWYRHHAKRRGVALEINGNVLAQTPIRTIDFSIATERTVHNRLVELVEQMLKLQTKLSAARTSHDQTSLSRQITAVDSQIDRLVYTLYGLSEAETRIVEDATGSSLS